MRILIIWGSKRGGTEGIARSLAETLQSSGHDVTVRDASSDARVDGFDAVLVGGALYANRWVASARRFVAHHERELRRVPTWFFSSGPLDASAAQAIIPPTRQVAILMERVGALGHATFGGRLAPDAKGFPASAMAKQHAGDWRDAEQIRTWAADLARSLPLAKPGISISHRGHSLVTLAMHGVIGWAGCVIALLALREMTSMSAALVMHALIAPAIFGVISHHYFAARGARAPLAAATIFVGMTAVLDLVVIAGVMGNGIAMFASIIGYWVPLLLIFAVTVTIGTISSIGTFPAHSTSTS